MVDRRVYLPKQSWCDNPDRRDAAAIPDEVEFATKPRLALDLIDAAVDAGVPASWVTGDEVYGSDPDLRTGLEDPLGELLQQATSPVSLDDRLAAQRPDPFG